MNIVLKIFDLEKAKFNNYHDYEPFCCLALEIDAIELNNLHKLLNYRCKSQSNDDNIFKFKNLCNIHVKPEILNSETNQDDKNACLFHDYDQKLINTLFTDNECRCDIKKPLEIQFDSKNYQFKLSNLKIASEKAQKILKKINKMAKIEKALLLTIQESFKKQFLYFYKISEILEVKITNEKIKILKITVLVFFKIGEFTKKLDFFYFENLDNGKIVDYEMEKVQESQSLFKNFFKNFICLLKKDNFGFYENYNIFYYMFLHQDIQPCNINCSHMVFLKSKTTLSYINYVRRICSIYENKCYKFKLYKFKFENYELINDNFCSIFEYNDQKMI